MAERARVVRRLGDVVADINAELELAAVLDRIAASLTELTGADAGGFVLIEGERLRLVSMDGLPDTLTDVTRRPAHQPGRRADATREDGDDGDRRDRRPRRPDLVGARRAAHDRDRPVRTSVGRPYGALYALYSRRKVGHIELELLELLAGHAGVALGNAMAFEEVVRQRAHERAVIDASADGIAVLDRGRAGQAVEPGRAPADRRVCRET